MKVYVASLAMGVLVGVIYGLFNVRSPAPPVIALVGLLGILLGEQVPPLVKRLVAPQAQQTSFLRHQVQPHMFGQLPTCPKSPAPTVASAGTTEPNPGEHRHG
ncbi:XapX domain containing protein [Burkholderia sp. lig30]|jgi:XapX domain-containing protein|uniref:DUF1427 family protein n=1 Tax=Burkholderia sp. lig30 TaxID=1192124 RepID=UPI000460C11D|nr:DUF1427 family protein [Burkholderia sp. lig30]KDB07617.1 XapX domain containing protein [Burkholderia sp. lig30]